MNLSASVQFRNALAHYSLVPEAEGVFLAQLQAYEGNPKDAPPSTILLARGIRRWTGSVDNSEVLEALGQVLEGSTSPDPSSSAARLTQPSSREGLRLDGR